MSARVFLPPGAQGPRVVLDAAESHYLRRVRRLREGAALEALDGRGAVWRAELVGGDEAASEILLCDARPAPAPARELVLLLGMPEPSAVLDLLPALCELGVAELALVRCARSQGAAPGAERVARVLRAAQRQCGRPTPPAVSGPHGLAAALELRRDLPGYFAWEDLRAAEPGRAPAPAGGARLLVGPEGGLTAEEVAALRAAGFVALGLGPYVLRSGTAATVGLARLLFA